MEQEKEKSWNLLSKLEKERFFGVRHQTMAHASSEIDGMCVDDFRVCVVEFLVFFFLSQSPLSFDFLSSFCFRHAIVLCFVMYIRLSCLAVCSLNH